MSTSVVSHAARSSDTEGVHMKPIPVRDIETLSNNSARRVKHLLRLNHTNYSILYNSGRFHNHSPHFLAAAYLLGASAEHLDTIYDDAVSRDNLEPWTPSPHKITLDNHRDYLTKAEYQRAWVDFFDDQIETTDHSDQWQSKVTEFLLETGSKDYINSEPLLYCLTADLGHPLIHLGYAFELNSREVAIEALSLATTCYDPRLASLLTAPSPSTSTPTSDLFEILSRVYNDKTLPKFPHPSDSNVTSILINQRHLNSIISHLNSWTIANPTVQLSQAQHHAPLILISTSPQIGGHGYDFFLVHVLTTAHAVGAILPRLPAEHHATILREWLLMTLLTYTAQNRPRLDPAYVKDFELQGRGWEFVRGQALEGEHASDAHFVKACHAMIVGAETLGGDDENEWFLRCAVRFASEFEVWGGFDPEEEGAEEARMNRIKDGIHV